MRSFVLSFRDLNKTKLMTVGGKGANLGELSKIDGINVPDGFCISTAAFKRVMEENPVIGELLVQLSKNQHEISTLSAEIRKAIEAVTIPADIEEEIISLIDESTAYAVRSSATAEDLPTASFAGQQDTYLNITGKNAVLRHISKCWASLFTERAIVYRFHNNVDHRKVFLAIVVQQMVFPQVAGVLFTADPLTSNRKVSSIDASFGLGEALVAGLVNADNYKVSTKIDKKIATKKLAVLPSKNGGTIKQAIAPEQQNIPALTDEQILQLERIGRKIETHFGCPQDIEWCLSDNTFYIVQSRPVTTLYPIPERDDNANHVYISVGHQQMMTDPVRPLGLSLFQLIALRPMYTAGGRLFVDITTNLSSAAGRKGLAMLGQADPLIKDAIETIIARDFIKLLPDDKNEAAPLPGTLPVTIDNDPAIVTDLIQRNQASVDELKQKIRTKSGTVLIDFILEDLLILKQFLFDPKSADVVMAAMRANWWINDKMKEWLNEKNVADTLSQSLPDNVTSEMGLALLDLADVIRPYPEVINYLQTGNDLTQLRQLNGGEEALNAFHTFLDKYGMRCAGEIDITKIRWSEQPAILFPVILSNIKNLAPGASKQKFEQGLQEALQKEQELLERLKQLPDGEQKAAATKEKIALIRNFAGYREYPKYGKINRYFVYRQALLKEAERLVRANVITDKEDIYFLTLPELREVIHASKANYQLINERKEAFKLYEKLTPPRVLTSDGEIIAGKYSRDHLPAGAIAALAVSSGIVEGRARIIFKVEDADIEQGDILVTPFTDPGWTPLFVAIKGLVTEVGGLMTHGAVIAREYSLPAVVGAENATKLIKDGQRIRVNGTDGYVEILA